MDVELGLLGTDGNRKCLGAEDTQAGIPTGDENPLKNRNISGQETTGGELIEVLTTVTLWYSVVAVADHRICNYVTGKRPIE
jgi:hypothetical protein